jgi:hypothetical protein
MAEEIMNNLALSEFLNAFGIFIETDRDEKPYLNYRLFPTEEVLARCNFAEEKRMATDTFYEEFDSIKNKFSFDSSRYYRERKWEDENKPEFVEQTATNINNKCHIYIERNADKLKKSEEGFAPYLQFNFFRVLSLRYPNVILDELEIPQIRQPYSVVSIREEIVDANQISTYFKKIFEIAHNITLDSDRPLDHFYSKSLLRSIQNPIFPMFSKYMYALQLSEHYEAYRLFSACDPVATPVEIRVNIASNKDNQPCYNKLWLWLVFYQIHFFQTRFEHRTKDKKSAVIVRELVEIERQEIFEDESNDLLMDPDDYSVY